MSLRARGSEPQHADPSQAIGARKSGDNQLHRFRVLEVRIQSPPAASLRTIGSATVFLLWVSDSLRSTRASPSRRGGDEPARPAAERGEATHLITGRCHGRWSRWRTSSSTAGRLGVSPIGRYTPHVTQQEEMHSLIAEQWGVIERQAMDTCAADPNFKFNITTP